MRLSAHLGASTLRPSVPLSLVCFALVLAAAGTTRRLAHRISDASLDEVAAQVRAAYRPGDRIVVHPAHAIGPRLRLGDLDLIETDAPSVDELARARRVHWLELDMLGADPGAREIVHALGTVTQALERGGLRWETIDVAAPRRVLFDLAESVAGLRVTARYPDGVVAACDRFASGARWLCPRDPEWNYVGREILTLGREPRRCVWAHPVAGGGSLTLELPTLARSSAAQVVVGGGFTLHGSRWARAPVKVHVREGERLVATHTQPVDGKWRVTRAGLAAKADASAPTPVDAQAPPPLSVEITTSYNGAAHFCLSVVVEEP